MTDPDMRSTGHPVSAQASRTGSALNIAVRRSGCDDSIRREWGGRARARSSDRLAEHP